MITRYFVSAAMFAATIFASMGTAQVSTNTSLKGAYYFRQILFMHAAIDFDRQR